MLKRAWLSITRRKSRVILLFVIIFIVANLVLTTISIKNATNKATEFAKLSIGSEVTLKADMQAARKKMESSGSSSTTDRKEMIQNFERPNISIDDVEKIAKSKYVSDYTYSMSVYANVSDDFQLVESQADKMGNVEVNSSDSSSKSRPEGNGNMQINVGDMMGKLKDGDISINAINSFSLLSSYKNKNISLTDGKVFDETTENPAIISYDLATLNDLKVGDTMSLTNTETNKAYTLTIVGIYDNAESESENSNFMFNSSNTIYTNITAGENFLTEDAYNEGNYTVSLATYYLDSPENYDAFITEANTLVTDLSDKNLTLSMDESSYEQMTGTISEIGNFSNIVLWVVIGAAVLIIAVIINGQVKERNYELGVLLSLGEKKLKILGQITIELVMISTIAFAVSIITSSLVSGKIADALLARQNEIATEQVETTGGRGMGSGMTHMFRQKSNAQTISTLDVSVGLNEMLILFGLGYLIVIIAMSLPAIQIVRYDPKTIFSRKE